MLPDFFEGETKSWEGLWAYLDRKEPGGAGKFIAELKESRRHELAVRKLKIRESKHPVWAKIKDVFWHLGEDFFCARHNLNPDSEQ